MNDEQQRLERLCGDNDDVILMWDDQLFGLAAYNESLVKNCRLNRFKQFLLKMRSQNFRLDIPIETNNHPVPRLEKSLEDGEYLHVSFMKNFWTIM